MKRKCYHELVSSNGSEMAFFSLRMLSCCTNNLTQTLLDLHLRIDLVCNTPSQVTLDPSGHFCPMCLHLKTIRLWVIGMISVNVSSETLSRAYYGCFSESPVVPSEAWMPFDQDSPNITINCVQPKEVGPGSIGKTLFVQTKNNRFDCFIEFAR